MLSQAHGSIFSHCERILKSKASFSWHDLGIYWFPFEGGRSKVPFFCLCSVVMAKNCVWHFSSPILNVSKVCLFVFINSMPPQGDLTFRWWQSLQLLKLSKMSWCLHDWPQFPQFWDNNREFIHCTNTCHSNDIICKTKHGTSCFHNYLKSQWASQGHFYKDLICADSHFMQFCLAPRHN